MNVVLYSCGGYSAAHLILHTSTKVTKTPHENFDILLSSVVILIFTSFYFMGPLQHIKMTIMR